MFRVRLMRYEDFSFAVKLSNTMNWNMDMEDFKLISSLEPQGCFVTYNDSEPIGIATCISYGEVGWFGNLIVKGEFRGQGVGGLLVKQGVDYLRSRGVGVIGLYAYPHLKSFYEKLGFRFERKFVILHQKNLSLDFDKKAAKASKQVFPVLIQFDRICFGANRERLLEAIFSGKNNLCYFSSDEGTINGYVAAKVYGEMAEIGPLICRPNQVDTAKMLLDTVLSQLKGYYVSVCLQQNETELVNYLFKNGFSEDSALLRMFLGFYDSKDCISIPESVERG